jgi:hypothetical protein
VVTNGQSLDDIKLRDAIAIWKFHCKSGGFLMNQSGAIRLGLVSLSLDVFSTVVMH